MVYDVESGNITKLLSVLTGQREEDVEKLLLNGMTPARVADRFGKLDEFKTFFKVNIMSKLKALIDRKEITVDEAYEFYKRLSDEKFSLVNK